MNYFLNFPCLEHFTIKDSKVKIILSSLSQTQFSTYAEPLGVSRAHNYSSVSYEHGLFFLHTAHSYIAFTSELKIKNFDLLKT